MPLNYITDYLVRNAERLPNKPALVTAAKSLSWQELLSEVRSRSGFFASSLSPSEQEVVALLMPNSWELVVTYLAVIEAGHIAMPIDVIYKPLEIQAILAQMQPKITIADLSNRQRLNSSDVLVFEELPISKDDYRPLRLGAEKQIASLVFTSGTTGTPKAAPYTHKNHLWNIKVCAQAWGWQEDDTLLLSLRLAHWYGICMGLSGAIYHGNTLHLEDRFDAKATLERLSRGDISLFTHTPIAFTKMLEIEGEFDLSKLRLPISGSAALPPDIWQGFKDRFGLEIIECYGSSETGRIASNRADDRRPGTPGAPLDEVALRLGAHDELLVSSPGLFPGYYKNPAATKQNLDGEGFWHTGDIAEFRDGRIYLKGRLVERIRRQGYSVSPRDVEWALRENEHIEDCLVVGTNEQGSDNSHLVYFIVGALSEPELREYTRTNLPSIWRPDKIIFLESMPRTARGKPDLHKLKAMI
jgi:acyl-CoA synthetase (AMP-forming)/AMP-acid ligase II